MCLVIDAQRQACDASIHQLAESPCISTGNAEQSLSETMRQLLLSGSSDFPFDARIIADDGVLPAHRQLLGNWLFKAKLLGGARLESWETPAEVRISGVSVAELRELLLYVYTDSHDLHPNAVTSPKEVEFFRRVREAATRLGLPGLARSLSWVDNRLGAMAESSGSSPGRSDMSDDTEISHVSTPRPKHSGSSSEDAQTPVKTSRVSIASSKQSAGSVDTADTLAKTKMCEFYRVGKCTKGENCTFAHNAGALRSLQKTNLCWTFKRKGYCPKGASCTHAHGMQELRSSTNTDTSRPLIQQSLPQCPLLTEQLRKLQDDLTEQVHPYGFASAKFAGVKQCYASSDSDVTSGASTASGPSAASLACSR